MTFFFMTLGGILQTTSYPKFRQFIYCASCSKYNVENVEIALWNLLGFITNLYLFCTTLTICIACGVDFFDSSILPHYFIRQGTV
jgi:hypothetical protein